MKIRNCSIDEFAAYEKSCGKKIILFGTGVIASIPAAYDIARYHLESQILFAVDNDETKWGTEFAFAGRNIPVRSAEALKEVKDREDVILLVTVSHFYEVICQLHQMQLEQAECFILPVMYVSRLHKENRGMKRIKEGILKRTEKAVIPKKIHYMWFGGKELPDVLKNCISSWKKFCPDYEIIRWDETNYDLNRHPYMRQAYERKQWGFIPDYGRLDILYEHGGIYLDTDAELIKPLDEMLHQEAFVSVEKWNVVNAGGGAGCIPHHRGIKKMLEGRRDILFEVGGKLNKTTCGYYDTLPFLKEGFCLDGTNQQIAGVNLYASEYFHPYDYMSGETVLTENTCSIHHFNGGWLDEKTILRRELTKGMYQKLSALSFKDEIKVSDLL